MFRLLRRHRTFVLVALAFVVSGLILFGVGGSSFMASPQDTAVKVNGHKISMQEYERVFRVMQRQQPDATSLDQQREAAGQVLNEMIRQQVLSEEAKRYGLSVTDDELRLQLASVPAFQRDGHFDPASYDQAVRRMFGVTPNEFEKSHKKDLAVRKLNLLIASSVHVSDTEVKLYADSIVAAEKDPKVKAELEKDPEKLREKIRERQVNLVFSDWLNRLNSDLKVSDISEQIKLRLNPPPVPGAPAAPPGPAK